MRIILFLMLAISWSGGKLFAQEQMIQGQVVNGNATPLPNVTVEVRDTREKTQTDRNGEFKLFLHSTSAHQLLFTSVGFEPKIVEVKAEEIDGVKVVLIEKTTDLEEVVISTGYQTLPKERATGSFSVVDNELFNSRISTDVISRLDGLVPGVLFDKRGTVTTNFQIRGLSTLADDQKLAYPLIILDNFPYEGDINSINPNDVESLTFLKDAAASSIWGAKAGNGVVVITTKKASYNQPFRVSISTNLSFSEKPNLWYPSQMSTSDYIDTEIFLFGEGAYNANLANATSRPVISPVVELLDQAKKGIISEEDAMSQIDGFRNLDLRNDYYRYVYRPAFKQQYAMNLTGGNEKLSYLLSTGWDKNLTELKENQMDRLTLRSINTFKPIKDLEVGVGVTYTLSHNQQNNSGPLVNLGSVAGSRSIYPYAQLADEYGNALAVPYNYRTSFVETAGDGKLLDWKYYPLEELHQKDNNAQTKNLLFNASANYKVFSWLTADLKYNYQSQVLNLRDLQSAELFSTRDMVNRFTVINGDNVIHNLPFGGILDYRQANLQSHNVRGQLNVDRQFGNDHQLNGLIGGEIRNSLMNIDAGTAYGYDDYLKISSQVDYVNRYPVFGGLASNQPIPFRDSYSQVINRFVSLYANASYRYLDRYTLSASARRDASNLFGVTTNNKWKPLWSVGAKWDIQKEDFYKSEFIPSLSVRATYGYSGNVNNSIPAVVTINYLSYLSNLVNNVFANLQNAPNSELRWESVNQINLATDFSFKNNRVSGTIEYYLKRSNDLISIMDADPTTGFSSLTRNSANVRNEGWEMQINSVNIRGEFRWETSFVFSINKNKLTKYLYKTSSFSSAVDGSMVPKTSGYPLNSLFSYQWRGLDPGNGDPLGYYAGEISNDYEMINRPNSLDDLYFHGSLLPQHFGSIRNAFGYKGVSLSFSVSGQFDYYFRRSTIDYSQLLSPRGLLGHGDYLLRWQKSGDELITTVPSSIYPSNSNRDRFYQYSEVTVEKGDYIRLQDMNLTYALRGRSKILENTKISCYANNLNWVLWKATKTDLDPLYNNRIPAQRSVAIGFTTNF